MYLGYVVDGNLLHKDPHFRMGCVLCHKGRAKETTKEGAHRGLVKKPSANLRVCGVCHKKITDTYAKSLHWTAAGQRNGVMGRFSPDELKVFDEKVFEQSCRSCHASCGDCHVKGPPVGGISIGLIAKHRFVKKDEGKTCAFCHGGRVYPEYVGELGGAPDVHYQKGMLCMDCHKKDGLHGDGNAYPSKNSVPQRPKCTNCHKLGGEAKLTARLAHGKHEGKATCYACHAGSAYRQCHDCHGGHSESSAAIILGRNPRDGRTLTTLRLIPTVRDTFAKAGIKMEKFDAVPNYWDTPAHNIRKRTERTRNCDTCHREGKHFLRKEHLIKNGAKANESLIMLPKPINR